MAYDDNTVGDLHTKQMFFDEAGPLGDSEVKYINVVIPDFKPNGDLNVDAYRGNSQGQWARMVPMQQTGFLQVNSLDQIWIRPAVDGQVVFVFVEFIV